MKEIKFRAYNKDWKMMAQPEDILKIYFDGVTNSACDIKFNITTTDGVRHDEIWEDSKDVILMQFTGLLDKNGKEIYEGDIVNWTEIDPMSPNPNKVTEVKWENWGFNFRMNWEDGQVSPISYEVIGNIYENPELL